jgi:hypothetical protein
MNFKLQICPEIPNYQNFFQSNINIKFRNIKNQMKKGEIQNSSRNKE